MYIVIRRFQRMSHPSTWRSKNNLATKLQIQEPVLDPHFGVWVDMGGFGHDALCGATS